jgi:hypothetical protein
MREEKESSGMTQSKMVNLGIGAGSSLRRKGCGETEEIGGFIHWTIK